MTSPLEAACRELLAGIQFQQPVSTLIRLTNAIRSALPAEAIPGEEPMTKPTDLELDNRFRYHKGPPSRAGKHEQVTELTLELAKQLRDLCPEGRNLALALTALEDVRMRANAALACDSPQGE